jgi:integral membrane protein
MVVRLLQKLENYRPFSEAEAWGLFRIVALAEAVGWSLLTSAIILQHFYVPARPYAVPIAGQLHGTIFLIYYAVSVVLYGSLGWSRSKMLFALASGVPPFGTLVFEQYASFSRKTQFHRIHRTNITRLILLKIAS